MIDNNLDNKQDSGNDENIYCRRCGRLLRGENSRNKQFGPNCYRIWLKERSEQPKLFDTNGGDNNEQ
jgi:hypothetical protein